MKKISTILIPFDFSKISEDALEYAVKYVGNDENLKIMLGHISNDRHMDELKARFETVEKRHHDVLKNKIEWVSMRGELTEALIQIQKSEQIDLIIMGTSGGTSLEPTNTSKLVLEADCPVLVVPSNLGEFRLKKIALVLGKEEIDDTEVLRTLLNVSQKFNAKVHVITIENRPETFGYSETDENNENKIQYFLENFYSEHVFIENPDVVDGILSYATQRDIDVITILPRNHTKKGQPSEGQLTELLTLHSPIPILAID
ncbi:universal stress protein [Subsaximicrobium wynnwilliamsii]|uniref:Universal stress protein n=1 Tax=Subsaximicrobium wynnwilliamsii TaxID=291179 RepID=A0A5C6ZHF3_9FLAO|nr:universal stress protein [Subsaximicrobium wynnwilliamsii]TXD83207.1 universal stress protein [Subsaximicrobium wynnwilliamsii]TXD88319.1 universal stress protein [Subsaximicrobium wynnwilliamsii]TXE03040.1 universal stress protein [Subsaximicrobium wynnwilliamsii]